MEYGLGCGVWGCLVVVVLAVSCSDSEPGGEGAGGAAGRIPALPGDAGSGGSQEAGGAAGAAGSEPLEGAAGSAGAGGSGGSGGSGGAVEPPKARLVYLENQVFIDEVRLLPRVAIGEAGAGSTSNPGNFVELVNETDEALALDACTLNQEPLYFDAGSAVIPAHGRLLVATDEDCCGGAKVNVLVDDLSWQSAFPSGQIVRLYCRLTFGQETFEVWYHDSAKPEPWLEGRTWQRCPTPMQGPSYGWSPGSGSPGSANVCP